MSQDVDTEDVDTEDVDTENVDIEQADIAFVGDVEETAPEARLRPDRNKHYAVAACGSPGKKDLPVYVDLDVMRDMEAHAQSDTSVELGGVLLGGQYEDEDGRPFVVVTDSLRARHFEATKGSFKFTHDTWTQISRERDEFPDDLQMVGWYHTHPDWGVFLSGMDMFICDNFFNRPFDVALVIDPCRGDRGWFQWTGNPASRIRRTDGFYLIASRFRREELELYAAQLEGTLAMTSDPRFSGQGPQFGPYPVVNISEPRSTWQGTAVMGMLTMQFLLLALIAWRVILPPGPATADADEEKKQADAVTRVADRIDRLIAAERVSARSQAESEVLFRAIAELKDVGVGDARSLVRQREEINDLEEERRAATHGFRALETEFAEYRDDMQDKLDDEKRETSIQKDRLNSLQAKYDKLKLDFDDQTGRLTKLEKQLKPKKASADEKQVARWDWKWIGISVAVVAGLLVGGVALALTMRQPEEPADEDTTAEEPADETNNQAEAE